MTFLGGAGLVLWLYRRGPRLEVLLISGLGLTMILSYFVQGKGFGYHLGGLIPLLVMLTSVCIEELLAISSETTTIEWRWTLVAITFGAIALTVIGTIKKLSVYSPQLATVTRGVFQPAYPDGDPNYLKADELNSIISRIEAGSLPDEYIFQWGTNFEVGYLAGRRSSSRFINIAQLTLLSDRFGKISDRFENAKGWLAEFSRDLIVKQPAFIIVERNSLGTIRNPLAAPTDASAALRILVERINSGYRIVMTNDKIVLFERE